MDKNYIPWQLERGQGPLVAVAIHSGHAISDQLSELIAISENERLRFEEPCAGEWSKVAPTRVVSMQSRFEFDLNRSRDKAVYMGPDDAWGLDVYKKPLPQEFRMKALAVYDSFYQEMHLLLKRVISKHGRVLVLDLHTCNHHKQDADKSIDEVNNIPGINVITNTLNVMYWTPLVASFISNLKSFNYLGRQLKVREDLHSPGGTFSHWVCESFPESACVLSVKVDNLPLDEELGVPVPFYADGISRALKSTIWGIYFELTRLERDEADSGFTWA